MSPSGHLRLSASTGEPTRIGRSVGWDQVKHLVVVAPPKALGILRGLLAPGIRAVLAAEIAKDLVKLPTLEIERHLSAMGQLPD